MATKEKQTETKKTEFNFFMLLPIVFAIILVGLFLVDKSMNKSTVLEETTVEKYQAIFLENGHVYFGLIEKEDSDYINLKDIYYLQLSSPTINQNEIQDQSNLKLVKLGTEIHGPENRMRINTDKVLFIEELREDSNVVKVINEDKSSNLN